MHLYRELKLTEYNDKFGLPTWENFLALPLINLQNILPYIIIEYKKCIMFLWKKYLQNLKHFQIKNINNLI